MARHAALALVIAAALLSGACAINRATATVDPSLKWDSIKSLHVSKLEGEDAGLQLLIAKKFRASGFEVTADPEPAVRPDALVTYVDRWMWDITMYMIELTIVVREAKGGVALATGNSMHTSLTRKSPQAMVDEVVDNILKSRSPQ